MGMETNAEKCQVLVIGAGPGGYLAAIRLAQLKKDVLLVEKEAALGGVCLNVGCIPSKALIHASDFMTEAKQASRMGLRIEGVSVDMKGLVQWKDQIVKKLTDGVKFLVEKNGGRILHGTARFVSDRRVSIRHDGGETTVDFENAIIATGSSTKELRIMPFDGKRIIDSTDALSLTEVPGKLVIIGAGYIGLEMGMVYRKLGSEVVLVETENALLSQLDPEVGEILVRRLKEFGANLLLGHKAEAFEPGDPSMVVVRDPQGNKIKLAADKVLVTVGRTPNSRDIGLEKAGVAVDERGFIKVNHRMETSVAGISAIGDVVGGPMLAHKAYREAHVAAEVIAGEKAEFDNVVVPAAVYTDPEIAWAGLSEKEARDKGLQVTIGKFPFRALGRALTLNAPEGFIKTIADAKTCLIKGVIMVGRDVSDLISEAALGLEMGATLEDMHATIHPHPSLSEALVESVDAALGQAIHIMNVNKESGCGGPSA